MAVNKLIEKQDQNFQKNQKLIKHYLHKNYQLLNTMNNHKAAVDYSLINPLFSVLPHPIFVVNELPLDTPIIPYSYLQSRENFGLKKNPLLADLALLKNVLIEQIRQTRRHPDDIFQELKVEKLKKLKKNFHSPTKGYSGTVCCIRIDPYARFEKEYAEEFVERDFFTF